MERTLTGFKETGSWLDIVELGERVTLALDELDFSEYDAKDLDEAYEEWNEWRPKYYEELDEEISEKTSEKASTGESKAEKEGKTVEDDIQKAGEKLSESYEKVSEEEDTRSAYQKWKDSLSYAKRAADTAGRKMVRSVEDTVYQNIMTKVSPYYFDNELISANISKTGKKEFRIEVNINNDSVYNDVDDKVDDKPLRQEAPDSPKTQTDTSNLEAVEGHPKQTNSESSDEETENSDQNES